MSATSLLNKFDNIVIDNIHQIKESDKNYCVAEEKLYIAAVDMYQDFYNELLKQWEVEKEFSAYRRRSGNYISEYINDYGDSCSDILPPPTLKLRGGGFLGRTS